MTTTAFCRRITMDEFGFMIAGTIGVRICRIMTVNELGLSGAEAVQLNVSRCPVNREFVIFSGPPALIDRLIVFNLTGVNRGQTTEQVREGSHEGLHRTTSAGLQSPGNAELQHSDTAGTHEGDAGADHDTSHTEAVNPCRNSDHEAEDRPLNHLTYLASPYTTDDDDLKARRVEAAAKVTGILFDRGELVIPAIPLGSSFLRHTEQQNGTWKTWERLDTELIRRCDSVTVLCLPGWRDSVGVMAEIEFARSQGKPIRYIKQCGSEIGGEFA